MDREGQPPQNQLDIGNPTHQEIAVFFAKLAQKTGREFKITYPEPVDLPPPSPERLLEIFGEEADDDIVHQALGEMGYYRNGRVIIDDGLADSFERFNWKESQTVADQHFYNRVNKMSGNAITGVITSIGVFSLLCQQPPVAQYFEDLHQRLSRRYAGEDELGLTYHQLSFPQKVEFTRTVDRAVVDIFRLVGSDLPQPS